MEEIILDILSEISGDDIVKRNKDIELFNTGLIDSLAFTELLIEIEDAVGVTISPTAIDRSALNTPNKIIFYCSTITK